MAKKSTNVLATEAPPGAKNLGIESAQIGRQFEPHFHWEVGNAENQTDIRVDGWYTGSGNRHFRVPFHLVDSARDSNSWQTLFIDAPWTMSITSTSINVAAKSGGIIDGITRAAYDDLLLWAFMDPFDASGKFKGLGFTVKPAVTYIAQSNGAQGSSTVFSLSGAGRDIGYRMTVGARVLCRESTALGALWNHGTITARDAVSITVQLDNSALYGTALVAAGGTIIQLDKFEPRLSTEDSLYPGGGSEYTFAYLGSLSIGDKDSEIGQARKRGDYYYLPTLTEVGRFENNVTSVSDTVRLGQWAPHHAREVEIEVDGTNLTLGFNNNSVFAYTSNHVGTQHPRIFTSPVSTFNESDSPAVNTGRLPPRRLNGGLAMGINSPLGDLVRCQVYLLGWQEDRF